ncbi:outer membrane autotransporter barrel protein [Rhodovulum sulfidophilum]|uniref:Outer membrane autotransporter barrel protein n=1 Tax=Rhodovulum sulfidophilum TaxID=35806 RepID=A0A0D6B120_RHOSU|nr:outer membrane autotransporter barrel protein [Rhodovulum sulfidophilum]
MRLTLTRTQKTALGLLQRGIPYEFDLSKPAERAVAEDLRKRNVATETPAEAPTPKRKGKPAPAPAPDPAP